MRNSCLNCARKHLSLAYILTFEKKFSRINLLTHIGQAEVLFDEFMTEDYEAHFWLAIGHLTRVENYFYSNPKMKNAISMADFIRKERVKAIDNITYRPDFSLIISTLKKNTKDVLIISKIDCESAVRGNVMEAVEETIESFSLFAKKMFKEYIQVVNKNKTWEKVDFIDLIEQATVLENGENNGE